MNAVDLFTRSGLYARDMDDWERRLPADQTYLLLRPFIQAAYQRRLTSGSITAVASGYSTTNDGTAETVVESINAHMANLSASVLTQSTASNEANTAIFNASIQQMAANEAKRNADHTRMMQQFMLMQTASNTAPAPFPQTNTQSNPVLSTIPVLGQTQQWAPQGYQSGGRGNSSPSRRGGRRNPPHRGNPPLQSERTSFHTFPAARPTVLLAFETPSFRTS
jgi:hypothetical protein